MLDVLHEPRFVDLAPAEVYATLLDEGVYLSAAGSQNIAPDGRSRPALSSGAVVASRREGA